MSQFSFRIFENKLPLQILNKKGFSFVSGISVISLVKNGCDTGLIDYVSFKITASSTTIDKIKRINWPKGVYIDIRKFYENVINRRTANFQFNGEDKKFLSKKLIMRSQKKMHNDHDNYSQYNKRSLKQRNGQTGTSFFKHKRENNRNALEIPRYDANPVHNQHPGYLQSGFRQMMPQHIVYPTYQQQLMHPTYNSSLN